jgi:hypothetical protein
MTPIRPKVGFEHKRDPELIDRVREMKRRSRYFAGEGFRIAPRRVGER